MVDLLCDTPDKAQFLKPGGGHARIFGPDGSPLAEPLAENAEGLLVAEIDLSMIAYAKSAADPVGHYSRPDVVRLTFNSNPNPVVMPFNLEHKVISNTFECDRHEEEKESGEVTQ